MSLQRAITRRLLRGKPRPDLLRSWPVDTFDVEAGLELGLPLAGLLEEALRSARAGRLLEVVLAFEDQSIDAALHRARLSFWLEESEHGFHYLAYVEGA